MPIKKNSAVMDDDDQDLPAPIQGSRSSGPEVFEFVDELPSLNRGGQGRTPDPETLDLIERLKKAAEQDSRYVYLGVKHTGQFNATLRNAGVHETFRKRADGEYDRFARYFGVDNLPPQRRRGGRDQETAD